MDKNVTLIEELGKFFFTMCPYEENIIYKSKPTLVVSQWSVLADGPQDDPYIISITWCHLGSYCCPCLLDKVFALECQVVTGKNQVDEL